MTRQKKTPKQRAEEALAAAERRLKRALNAETRLKSQIYAAETEYADAKRLHAYAAAHPALQTSTSTTNQEAGPA